MIAESALDETQRTELLKSQRTVLRKARLLAPKADAELSRLESQPTAPADDNTTGAKDATSEQNDAAPAATGPDPEAMKAGYRKAIELAPTAVHEMEAAIDQLTKKDDATAGRHAEEARRILEEIQQAQPRQESEDDQQKDDQQKDEQNKDDQQPDDESKKQDSEKKDSKDGKSKADEKSKNENKDKKSDQKQKSADDQKSEQPQQISQDRVEDALRRVRERQQQKRERDREARARVTGRATVEKDW
jgi:Ca-activated chloride channel family protein